MDRFFGLDKVGKHDEDTVLLTTVHDDVEKNLLCGILEEEEIPFLVKDRGSGEVMRIISGFSMFGSDIFVPTALLERAEELLDAYRNGEVCDEELIFDGEDAAEDGEEDDE